MREHLAQVARELLDKMNEVDLLRKERKRLSIFDFRGRRELKLQIKELEKQEDATFQMLERVNFNLM